MAQVKIGNRTIGAGLPPFIVAEAGVNHNGDLKLAFQMIEVAKKQGADAVKFQTFKGEEFVADKNQTFSYKSQGKEVTESMLEMFRRYEFSREQWFKIKEKCDLEGILFLSTPQNRSDLDLLLEIGVPAIKVGSDDFNNIPLLKDYATTKLPMIVSCGMATLAEVYESLQAIGALDGYPTILLQCTSQYPTPPVDINISKLKSLASSFPMLPVGFSDHSQGPLASSLAVAFGACFFEKHFTMGRDLPGPDHWFSEDPTTLAEWINSIKTAYTMLGSPIVRPTNAEVEIKLVARRSIVALQDIKVGESLDKSRIGLMRPGTGLPPSLIDRIFGLKSTRTIKKGEMLKWGDFT